MGIEFIWKTKRSLLIEYKGVVSGQQLTKSVLDISGDPRLDDLRNIIADWSQVKSTEMGTEDIEKSVAYIKAMTQSNPHIKNAIVMSDDESRQALSSYYKFLTEEIAWEIEIFDTLEEARAWLDKEQDNTPLPRPNM